MDSSSSHPASAAMRSLINSRLVMVTGKGGTGKTTYAAALAVLAAASGRRTLLCEVDTQRPSMAAIFETIPGYEPEQVRAGLDLCNLHWDGALIAFLHKMVPVGRIVKLILKNTIVQRFLDFTPGLREMVTLSALGGLVEEYDLVVVDMPASGHAFSLLDIIRSAMGLFRSGPVRRRAGELAELLRKPDTRLVFVALPEEMVVNETIETFERMKASDLFGGEPMVFLNRSTLPTLTPDERDLIHDLSQQALDPLQAEFVRAGRWEDQLEQETARSRDRLSDQLPGVPVLVPPSGSGGVPRHVVGSVVVHLGRLVGLTRREIAWT